MAAMERFARIHGAQARDTWEDRFATYIFDLT